MNHADMGNYQDAINEALLTGTAPNLVPTRAYSLKYGYGLNIAQELTSDLGFFSRLGWNDGHTETWALTDIDRTASAGFSLKGLRWSRPADTVGLAIVANGLSPQHRQYLEDGGVSFLIGDGRINYAPEQIIETYYAFHFWRYWTWTTDVQGVKHPAYNADRGPVLIAGERVHIEF